MISSGLVTKYNNSNRVYCTHHHHEMLNLKLFCRIASKSSHFISCFLICSAFFSIKKLLNLQPVQHALRARRKLNDFNKPKTE